MLCTENDKILTKNLFEFSAKQLVGEFASKCWNVGSACELLQKLRVTGSVDNCSGCG